MTTKHTPGPWKKSAGIIHTNGHALASLPMGNAGVLNGLTDPDEVAANGDLMAAAPDLLAALKEARDEIHNPGQAFHRDVDILGAIEAAIAKAEGRP